MKSPLKINDCNSFRDTFEKILYIRLFIYLVKKMNNKLFDEKIKELQNLCVEDIFKKLKICLLKKIYKIILLKLNNNRAILNAIKQEFFINYIMNVMLVKMI